MNVYVSISVYLLWIYFLSLLYTLGVTAKTSHYKLVLSLKSGLPNELDFVFNALTILSSDEYDPLILSAAPSLLDLMLAQVGIYDECEFHHVC